MRMHTNRRGALTPLALSIALALSACGGSSNAPQALEPGEVLSFTVTQEDGETQQTRYMVHGVTAEGDLVTDTSSASGSDIAKRSIHVRPPLAGVLVALPMEPGDVQHGSSPRLLALRDFYKQLWQGIAERRNDGSDIAAEIGAFETDVGVLYDDWRQSGLVTVKDYVVFYEQVGENPYFDAQESVEEELVFFFHQTGWRKGEWLQALQRQGLDWPRFLGLMAERRNTFAGLLHQYQMWSPAGDMVMEAFIARYVAGPHSKAAYSGASRTMPADLAKADHSAASGAGAFAISNTSWRINISSRQQSSANILSSEDTNLAHYQRLAEKKNVCPTRLTVSGRLGVVRADLEWKMRYTEEKHTSLPGTWVTAFGIDTFNALGKDGEVIDTGWNSEGAAPGGLLADILLASLGASMEIRDVKNVGTEAAPRPGFTARVKVTPGILFNSPWVRDCKVN